MIRSMLAVLLAVGMLSACKKKKEEPEPAPIPVGTAPAPAQVASESAAASSAPPAEGAGSTALLPPPTPTSNQPAKRESIEACCAALAAYKTSGRPKKIKDQAANGARVCRGAAPAVRDGKTSRQAALAQVRAASPGVNAPECQ